MPNRPRIYEPKPDAITSFRGDFAFLSNIYPSPISIGELVDPTAEHAFQMLKTDDPEERRCVCAASTPALAKRRGKKVTMRPDWLRYRLKAMEAVLRLKFSRGSELAATLLATGDAELVEGNAWGDQFWGVSRGRGQNHLGRLLMKLRAELLNAYQHDTDGHGGVEPRRQWVKRAES
jgi:N-glycosidase YbiA